MKPNRDYLREHSIPLEYLYALKEKSCFKNFRPFKRGTMHSSSLSDCEFVSHQSLKKILLLAWVLILAKFTLKASKRNYWGFWKLKNSQPLELEEWTVLFLKDLKKHLKIWYAPSKYPYFLHKMQITYRVCLFIYLNGHLLEGRKLGIPLGILPYVQEQNKCPYFNRPGQS